MASLNGKIEIVRYLIEKYSDGPINYHFLDQTYTTKNIDIIKYLIINAKNILINHIHGFINNLIYDKNTEIIKLLLSRNDSSAYYNYIFESALRYRSCDILQLLLDMKFSFDNYSGDLATLLIDACRVNNNKAPNLVIDNLKNLPHIDWDNIHHDRIDEILYYGHYKLAEEILIRSKQSKSFIGFNRKLRNVLYTNEKNFIKLLTNIHINPHINKLLILLQGCNYEHCPIVPDMIRRIIKIWYLRTVRDIYMLPLIAMNLEDSVI